MNEPIPSPKAIDDLYEHLRTTATGPVPPKRAVQRLWAALDSTPAGDLHATMVEIGCSLMYGPQCLAELAANVIELGSTKVLVDEAVEALGIEVDHEGMATLADPALAGMRSFLKSTAHRPSTE